MTLACAETGDDRGGQEYEGGGGFGYRIFDDNAIRCAVE